MGRFASSMVVLFLLALVLQTSPAKAINCMSAIANVLSCSNFLQSPNNFPPESSCCNAARTWISLGDVDSFCKCVQPITSNFISSKAQQLPDLCNLDPDSYLPIAICLAPPPDTSNGGVPTLPFVNLPPMPFGPPAENLEKNVATVDVGTDGILPPLPSVPLPPLPLIPPLPKPIFPLPPLPFPLPPLPFPLPPLPFPLPPLPFPPLPFVPPAEKHD